jgi:Putative beta-barrel porin-2, OmpL-like. bbp2
MRRALGSALVVVTLGWPGAVRAQAPPAVPAPPAAPAPSPPPAGETAPPDGLSFEGLIDAYYAYQVGGAGVQVLDDHKLDSQGNSFTLALAKVALALNPRPVGVRLDVGFGPANDVIASDPGNGGVRFIQQAYLTFAVSTRVPLTIDVGKFFTGIGAEVIEAPRNWNYSRSFLFEWALPFSYTGLRLSAALTPRLTLQAVVVNGWDLVFDNNGAKTFGLSLNFVAPTGTTIALHGLGGIETVGNAAPWRLLADLVVTQTLGRVDLRLCGDFVREGQARWFGAAGYARVAVASHLNLALRGEIFVDHAGRLIANQNTRLEEITFTVGIPITRNAELRAEARGDFADQPLFLVDTEVVGHQGSLLASALAWF